MPANKPADIHRSSLSGVLVLDKPRGLSSMQAVAAIRRSAGRIKTGHAGTLDPLATGVLVIAVGRATKIISTLMETTKRYRTAIDLRAFTTTDDAEGEATVVPVTSPPSEADVRSVINTMVGEVMQRPPAFSAIKINGRRAYKMARSGESPDVPPRPVQLLSADLIAYDWPIADVELHTGKGFYVRSFARDLGVALGTGGHCGSLRRTAVGPFTLENAFTLDALPEQLLDEHLIPPQTALELVAGHQSHATGSPSAGAEPPTP